MAAHHHHHHHHHHHYGHCHYDKFSRAFALGVLLNVVYIVIEVGVGLSVNSLALLADAGHNLSDVVGLLLAWLAHWLTRIPASERRTYGWRSSTILAAVVNSLLLLVVIGGLLWEAIERFQSTQQIPGLPVIIVAASGVMVNTLTALLFVSGRHDDLNLRGAFLHMAADAAVSLGVVVGGACMLWFGWQWIDPVMTILIAAVIFYGTWGLLLESVNLLLHAVPERIDPVEVQSFLENLPEVREVHDMHIWAMSTTEICLTAHLVVTEIAHQDEFLHQVSDQLAERFEIGHATLQVELGNGTRQCALADRDRI